MYFPNFVCTLQWYNNILLILTWSSFPYKIGRLDPSGSCIIRACIGMPFSSTVSSNPTICNAVRPRVERARLMLRPLTCSAFLISAKKYILKLMKLYLLSLISLQINKSRVKNASLFFLTFCIIHIKQTWSWQYVYT